MTTTSTKIKKIALVNSGAILSLTNVTDYFGRKENTVTRFNGWGDASKITTSYTYKSNGTKTSEQLREAYNSLGGQTVAFVLTQNSCL